MLNKQQKYVLHRLLDKYEKRKDYGKLIKNNRRTMLQVNKREFPDYFHISDSTFKKEWNVDALELEKEGYIVLEWQKFKENEEMKRVILQEKKMEDIYAKLQRVSKQEKYRKIEKIVFNYQEQSPSCLSHFYEEVINKLKHYQSLPSIFNLDSEAETELALFGLHQILNNKEEIPRRNWSIHLYNDSKKWEKLESRILSVVRSYVQIEDVEIFDDGELLATFGILKNPRHIQIAGDIVLSRENQRIDLSVFTPDIGLEPRFLVDCKLEAVYANAVVTIENLTSYYDYLFWKEKNNHPEIVLYLGGYHNEGRRLILSKLNNFFKEKQVEIPFYHWGDMDLHGIYIWNHLQKKTGIDMQPLYMDEKTYLKYMERGKKLESADRKKLEKLYGMKEYAPFHLLIREMLKGGKVIEQEAVNL